MSVHATTKGAATKRVLIVDDEAIVLTVLRDFFASFRHGYMYEITTAESASGAFQILRREQFELILLDVVIPAAAGRWLSESNLGFSLLARLRDLGVTAPVLVMTGGGSSAKEAGAVTAGAAGFLYKPVGLRELDLAVTRALRSASGGIASTDSRSSPLAARPSDPLAPGCDRSRIVFRPQVLACSRIALLDLRQSLPRRPLLRVPRRRLPSGARRARWRVLHSDPSLLAHSRLVRFGVIGSLPSREGQSFEGRP